MNDEAPEPQRRPWSQLLLAAAVAMLLFAIALWVHLRNACTELDTPYLPLCPGAPTEPEEIRGELRERIARNPGDSTAWTHLLASETMEGGRAILPGATLAAPNHHNVARWRAMQALETGKMEEGVAMLVQILRHRRSPETASLVAQMAASPEGVALLQPHLSTASEWLPKVLHASRTLKQPPSDLLPLVVSAIGKGGLPPADRQAYMRSLKSTGQWLDAYGLWVAQHKDQVPLLYNPSFDQRFEPDGFDWEYTRAPRSRAGVLVSQEPIARRGQVVEVEFTGRRFATPVLRQYLFVPPGSYRLRGDYMVARLRSEEGLAWTVACTGSRTIAGRSQPLKDTGGAWRVMEIDFQVPGDCGAVVSLQLEPAGAYEAATGIKGRAAFDAFSLARTAGSE